MGSRERRRAERRKRKRRAAEGEVAGEESSASPSANVGSPAGGNGAGGARAEPERPLSPSELKDREAREALQPLREDERPLVVTIGAVISAVLALSVVGAYAAGAEVDGDRPETAQVLAPAILMGVMAWGMWRARYWAVLGFQVVLLFLILATAIGLLGATNAAQVLGNLALLSVGGAFFYFMVKALARIQMPQRLPRD
jgi:hypothetical protein